MTTPDDLVVTNALIFDGSTADLTEGAVQIRDGVIVSVGTAEPGADTLIIDASGRTVMPGLIDAHFHAYGAGLDMLRIEAGPLSYLALAGARRLRDTLSRGFTTVRDVAGGDPGLARAISEGLVPAPRYLYTGPALSQTGGHGDARPGDLNLCTVGGHMCQVVDGVDDLRRVVRERFRTGAHAIKVMASGGVISPTDPIRLPQYSAEEIRAVTDEATRRDSYVAAHSYSPAAIVHAVTNGVRTIEHGNLLDPESAAVMAAHDAFLVPTLVAYDSNDRRADEMGMTAVARQKNSAVLDAGRAAIEIARAADVPIGFGTDLMGDLDNDQLIGLRLQMEVDGSLAVLRSVTSVNADILRRPDLGRIAVGTAGDLLVLDGNPLDDPAALWNETRPRTVIQGGRVVHGRDTKR